MEKYSQFRDKGSGIAPFFPVPPQPSGIYLPFHIFFFLFRFPLFLALTFSYFLLFCWLPAGSLLKKAALWAILAIPGVWWIDLQIDGVKRGSLAKHKNRLPHPGTIIVSSFTSPIDCLYLAAIFDPIFTASYPNTRLVQRISLVQAMLRALSPPQLVPPPSARLVPLSTLLMEHPDSAIVVLPECTSSNGRAILTLSPSILTAPAKTKIFPINLRYSPADITTPIPGAYLSFLWDLCSKPTHCIRVRIAEAMHNTSMVGSANGKSTVLSRSKVIADNLEVHDIGTSLSSTETLVGEEETKGLNAEEKKVLDRVGDDLARLGRAKRVGLGVREKIDFVKTWTKTRTVW